MKNEYIIIINITSILILSIFISGCVDNTNNPQNEPSSIAIKELESKLNDCSSLTELQCDNWIKNEVNGKYFRWSGKVVDISSDGSVDVFLNDDNRQAFLHDIKNQDLLKLNKGDFITFTGRIDNVHDKMSLEYQILTPHLYDVKIEETPIISSNPVSTNNIPIIPIRPPK
jgi:hypothetical protein